VRRCPCFLRVKKLHQSATRLIILGTKNDFSLTPALSPLYTTFPCYYFHSIVVAQLRAIAHYCMQYNQRRRLVKSWANWPALLFACMDEWKAINRWNFVLIHVDYMNVCWTPYWANSAGHHCSIFLTLSTPKAIIVPHRIIRSWHTDRWWVGCYIWYSEWAGPQHAQALPCCTNCNIPPINGQFTSHRIAVRWSIALRF